MSVLEQSGESLKIWSPKHTEAQDAKTSTIGNERSIKNIMHLWHKKCRLAEKHSYWKRQVEEKLWNRKKHCDVRSWKNTGVWQGLTTRARCTTDWPLEVSAVPRRRLATWWRQQKLLGIFRDEMGPSRWSLPINTIKQHTIGKTVKQLRREWYVKQGEGVLRRGASTYPPLLFLFSNHNDDFSFLERQFVVVVCVAVVQRSTACTLIIKKNKSCHDVTQTYHSSQTCFTLIAVTSSLDVSVEFESLVYCLPFRGPLSEVVVRWDVALAVAPAASAEAVFERKPFTAVIGAASTLGWLDISEKRFCGFGATSGLLRRLKTKHTMWLYDYVGLIMNKILFQDSYANKFSEDRNSGGGGRTNFAPVT